MLSQPSQASNYATGLAQEVEQVTGIILDYSPTSLSVIDSLLEHLRQTGFSSEFHPDILIAYGCYVGEVIIRHIGGSWQAGGETQVPLFTEKELVLALPSGIICDPISKIYKRFTNGEPDSLTLFYHAVQRHELGDITSSSLPQEAPPSQSSYRGPIANVIHRISWKASGRTDALAFVINTQGNLEQIDIEIQEQSTRILNAAEQGPMHPGASPRVWLDSYLETLHELRALVSTMQQEGKTW